MDELDIQILLSLAETGSLTKTAASLFLAQPTLTKRLQNLEQDLGATLFLRSKKRDHHDAYGREDRTNHANRP